MILLLRKLRKYFVYLCFIFFNFFTGANADTITLRDLTYTNITSDWEQGVDKLKLIAAATKIGSDSFYTFDPKAAFIIEAVPYLHESGTPFYSGKLEVRNDVRTDEDGNIIVNSDGNVIIDSNVGDIYVSATFNNLTAVFKNLYGIYNTIKFTFAANDFLSASGLAITESLKSDIAFTGTWVQSQQDETFSGLIGGDGLVKPQVSNDPGNVPTPEPATFMLFGLGLLGLAGIGRKHRA